MAKHIQSAKDEGECLFNTDLAKGKIAVTIRAPLSIDKRTVEINISDLLEVAANVTLESIKYSRTLQAEFAKQTGTAGA